MKQIAVLGSTGSIGTQTLDIIEEHPECFHARLLVAGKRWELLASQARKFLPSKVIIGDDSVYGFLKEALRDLPIEVASGADAIVDAMSDPETDLVVAALVGYAGLAPTLAAIRHGKTIALANKETLVAAGAIVTQEARRHGAEILPVDSEHSAIFQCLRGENVSEARKIILTASGGPFRKLSREEMGRMTATDALRHPNWNMGPKVTVDSASMMNKGFEMMEASWLFGCPPSAIEIAVHPQSVVHSMVEFVDGSIKAQLGVPDMRIPIRYALGYPRRLVSSRSPLSLEQYASLTFEPADTVRFPLLRLAFEAMERGGNIPCLLNAANEIGVKAFLEGRIGFNDLPDVAERVMSKGEYIPAPVYEDIVLSDREGRQRASEIILSYTH